MLFKTFLPSALFAVIVLAERRSTGSCAATAGGECFVVDLGYYSDDQCSSLITSECFYGGDANNNCSPDNDDGSFICPANPTLPNPPFYARIDNTDFVNIDVEFLSSSTDCTTSGVGGGVASLLQNDGMCVEVTIGGSNRGIALFPQGTPNPARRDVNDFISPSQTYRRARRSELVPRADINCNGWQYDSQEDSTTPDVQVSVVIDCPADGDDCMISDANQTTTSVASMYSVTAGGSVEGFSAMATFGMTYTDSQATTLQETFSVPAGQSGYLIVNSAATTFTGDFTGCNTVTSSAAGTVVAVKANALHYSVTLTS